LFPESSAQVNSESFGNKQTFRTLVVLNQSSRQKFRRSSEAEFASITLKMRSSARHNTLNDVNTRGLGFDTTNAANDAHAEEVRNHGNGVSRIDQCKFDFCFSRRLIGDGSCAMGAVCTGNIWGDDRIVGGSFLLSWLVHD
jgi:hypothetical protein